MYIFFDKQDNMQLLAKFKNILYMGLRTTLNFRKFKVAAHMSFGYLRHKMKAGNHN